MCINTNSFDVSSSSKTGEFFLENGRPQELPLPFHLQIFSSVVFGENLGYCYSLGVSVVVMQKLTKIVVAVMMQFFLNPFPNNPWFLSVCSTSLLKKLWDKKKLLGKSNFFFSHSVFYPFRELSISVKFEIVICKLFQFGIV